MNTTATNPTTLPPALTAEQPSSSDLQTAVPAGPVLQIERQSGLVRLHLREDVDVSQSLWFWNGTAVQDLELVMDQEGLWNLSYELRNKEGEILESSEQSFVQDFTAPIITWNASSEDLWIYEEQDLLWQVQDAHLERTEVFIDGQPVSSDGCIRLNRDMKHVLIQSYDAFGNKAEKELFIKALPKVISPWAESHTINTREHHLEFVLDGDWNGMSIQVLKDGSLRSVPFESAHLNLSLPDGPSTIQLIHPEKGLLTSWNVTKIQEIEQTDPPAAPLAPPAVLETEEEEAALPEPDVQDVPVTIPSFEEEQEVTAVPSLPSSEMQEISVTQSAAVFEMAKPALPTPLKAMLKVDGTLLKPGQKLYFDQIEHLVPSIENGSFQSISFQIQDGRSGKKYAYDKLEDALKNHPEKAIQALVKAQDSSGKTSTQSFSLIPQGTAISTLANAGRSSLQSSFSLDAHGKIQIQSSKKASPAALLLVNGKPWQQVRLKKGQEMQLYTDSSAKNIQVLVNGREIKTLSKQDSLGQTYIPIAASGSKMNIEVIDADSSQTIHQSTHQAENPNLWSVGINLSSGLVTGLILWLKSRGA